MRKLSCHSFTSVRNLMLQTSLFLKNILWFVLVKILKEKKNIFYLYFVSFMSWLIFNLSQRIWSKWKRSCLGYSKLHTFFKLLVSNYSSYLVHLFSESKDKHENLNKEKQNENESLSPLPQHSADLNLKAGRTDTTTFWSFFFLTSCIIFVFSRQFTDCWVLLYIPIKMQKQ